jgi:hypothetical protein
VNKFILVVDERPDVVLFRQQFRRNLRTVGYATEFARVNFVGYRRRCS